MTPFFSNVYSQQSFLTPTQHYCFIEYRGPRAHDRQPRADINDQVPRAEEWKHQKNIFKVTDDL